MLQFDEKKKVARNIAKGNGSKLLARQNQQIFCQITTPNIGRAGLLVDEFPGSKDRPLSRVQGGASPSGTTLGDAQAAVAHQALLRTGAFPDKPGVDAPSSAIGVSAPKAAATATTAAAVAATTKASSISVTY